MIVSCAACNARYLVPATVFANGPRFVRCARCGNTWQESLPPDPPAAPVQTSLPPDPVVEKNDSSPPSFDEALKQAETNQPEKTEVEKAEPHPSAPSVPEFTEPPETTPPIPKGSGLPVVWSNPIWKKIIPYLEPAGFALLGVAVVVSLIWFIVDRENISKKWPAFEGVYYAIGLGVEHPEDGLSFQNVRSERKIEDGYTQLVVYGEIRNDSSKDKVLPAIRAKAIGADGGVMQDWQIDAPAVKLSTNASIPFRSSVKAPDGAVVEVTLMFLEIEKNGNGNSH